MALTKILTSRQGLAKDYDYEILHRFGIACRHHLLRAFLEDIALPITLLHPRWWLNGGPITSIDWQPSYPDTSETQSKTSPPLAPSLSPRLARMREDLNPDEQYRFDRQLEQGTRQIAQFQNKTARDLVRISEQRLQL